MVAGTFHDDVRTGIAHAESLARNAGNKSAAACRAVERDIADDDVFGSLERAGAIREDDQSPAGKPLAEIVVAVSLKRERHALRQKCTERLSSAAAAVDLGGIILQRAAPASRDLCTEERAECTVRTGNIDVAALRSSRFPLFRQQRQKHLLVQRRIQLEIKMLRRVIVAVFFATAGQDARDVYHRSTLRNLMRQDTQILRMADQFVNRAHTELCHDHAQLLRNKLHEIDHIVRLAAEVFPQLRTLGRDAHRTGKIVKQRLMLF